MTKYVVEVTRVNRDFYTGAEEITWIRKKETYNTKEEAVARARKCRNAWVVVKVTVNVDTMKIKEKIVADQLHN